MITALALKPIVPPGAAHERAQENKFVRRGCHLRHQFSEMHAGDEVLLVRREGGSFYATALAERRLSPD